MNVKLEKLLKETKKNLKGNSSVHDGLISFRNLIDCFYQYIEEFMDKQIAKVKKDIDKGNKKKGEKDVKKLMKMDKKFDKKIDKAKACEMKMKKKGM